jgi:bacillolysin
MKRLVSLLTMVLMVTLILTPMTGNAKNSTSIFKVKKMGKYTKDMNGIVKFFKDNKAEFDVVDPETEFTTLSESDDNLGYKHIKLQQMVDNIPVFGNQYIVHYDATGEIYAVNGNFDSDAKNYGKNKNFINPNKAVQIAKDQVSFDKDSLNVDLVDNLVPKLYLYNVDNNYVPIYLVRVNFLSPDPGDWHIFVNANSGEVVHKYNQLASIATTATGLGVVDPTPKTLNVNTVTVTAKGKTTTQYQLKDTTRPATITTYTCGNGTTLPGTLVYSTTSTITDKAAVDAHFYAGVVYDFYKSKFNRNSLDNNNLALKSSVHYKRNYVNAFWNGTQMVYGDGDGVQSVALSGGLDVIGHEMTHGVTEKEANLTYANQSGALNESMSDVFGTFVEYYGQKDKFDWLIGEDIWTPTKAGDALRSMSNPGLYGDPENMSQFKVLPNTQAGDWGGVHTNSGIPNKAAYNVVMNLSSDLSVSIPKAQIIYYNALCNYMTPSTDFIGAKNALAQAATDQYGANSAEYNAVINAFKAVGIN